MPSALTTNTSLDASLTKTKEALTNFAAEFVVLCTPLTSQAEVARVQTAMAEVSINGRRVLALCTLSALKHAGAGAHANWAAYLTDVKAVVSAANAPRVVCVAPIFGPELGAFAGCLQKVLDEPQGRISRSPHTPTKGCGNLRWARNLGLWKPLGRN